MRALALAVGALLAGVFLLVTGIISLGDNSQAGMPASVTQWWGLIEQAAERYQVDPLLVAAVMTQESHGNPIARSSAGANGLMQVLGGPLDPGTNIDNGVRILAGHLQTFKDTRVALAAYNAGPGATDATAAANPALRLGGVRGAARLAGVPVSEFDRYVQFLPAETQRYVPAVMALYDRFSGGQLTVNTADGPVRFPLDKFHWTPTFGKNTGNGQFVHTGEDLMAPCGTPVKAAFNGDIVYRGCLYGNCKDGGAAAGATGHGLVVVEQFEPDKYAVYAHLANYVSDKSVKAGDLVGTIGMTGWTTACHLHYAIWQGTLPDLLKGTGNHWQDPKKYFPTAYLKQ